MTIKALAASVFHFQGIIQQDSFSALKTAKTVIIKTDDYDVFGDGTVIIKSAPGHTFEFNAEQSKASRAAIDAFVEKNKAQFCIEHDTAAFQKLKKSPRCLSAANLLVVVS